MLCRVKTIFGFLQKLPITTHFYRQSEPTVILGTTHAYSERGERFRTERHCWIGSQPHWFPSLQTCLLTLSRTVDFRSRDTVLPYHLPVHGRRKKAKNLIAFGFGSTTQGEYGVSKKLWALPMTWVPSEECMIPDSPKHHSCARSSLNEFGMLNHNDVGGPIMKDIDMELYALAGSWYLPVIPPGMPQYRSVIVPIAPILDEIYNEMDNRGDKCLK